MFAPTHSGASGNIIAAIKYATQLTGTTMAMMRTIMGSMLKYSPMPPHTPVSILLLRERYRRLYGSMGILLYKINGLTSVRYAENQRSVGGVIELLCFWCYIRCLGNNYTTLNTL